MRTHPLINRTAVGLACAVAASCNTGLAGPNGAVAAIQVTAAVDSAFALGDTVPFHATATDRNGATLSGVTYTWTSSAPDVAIVSKDGMVVAVGNGVATIQAAVNGVTGSAPFAVRQVAVGLAVALTHDTIATINHTVQALAHGVDANDQPIPVARVMWTSSNPAVVTVNDSGVVRGIASGQAVLRVEAAGFRDSTTLTVHQFPNAIQILRVEPYLSVRAGDQIFPQTIGVYDSAGYPLADDGSAIVTADVIGGVGQLVGRVSMPVMAGQVTFDSLIYEGSVGIDRLRFTEIVSGAQAGEMLTIQAGPAAAMFAISGEDQSGTAGSTLELPLEVKVVDAYGNGAFGSVSWARATGSGTLGSSSTWTDAYGLAQITYTLGATTGTDTVLATFDGIAGSPVDFPETTKPATTSSAAPSHQ